ncbi:hypothetical protein VT06_15280 [Arsukibacterium sp. MJ3]|uniref:hypothetical protein n=1 Tax=Arsukibacterium sp. MJ3 TaxID=1632859 RepID=UPI000627400C|nr:hypothetical protein [Arsukibacterium sp. MJ3]KKO47760.1 hypothetical protein VT06_15280 [Arsukibacterium sp. MJ3]
MTGFKQICDKAPLTLNADHSSSICDAAITRLNIKQTALRHLDLMQVTALEELEICCTTAAERHLRIQGAAALKQVTLHGSPANKWVVHIDVESFPHGLQLTGPISQLDMCWQKDTELLTLVAKHQLALRQKVHFYDLNQISIDDFAMLQDMSEQALVIFSGGFQQAMVPVFAQLPALLFTDIAGIDGLTVSGCQYLTVQRAIGLRSIDILDGALQYLQLQQCPQFSRLSAPAGFTAGQAQLTDAAHGSVELAGCWQSVKLRRSALTELSSDTIEQLHVTDCPNLTRLKAGSPLIFSSGIFAPELLDQASFSINEAMIRNTLQQLTERMDTELIEALLCQAARQFKPYNVCHAIMLLQALAQLNFPIAKLWPLRCMLYLKNKRRQIHFKSSLAEVMPQSWNWSIKADRLFETLEADVLLWLIAYRAGQENTKRFMSVMVHSALIQQPAGFFTLCNLLTKEDSPFSLAERLAIIRLFCDQITTHTHTWLTLNNALLPGLLRLSTRFHRLCQQGAELSKLEQKWCLALFDFLALSLSPKYLTDILPLAMKTFPEYVRPKLLAIANDTSLSLTTSLAEVSYESVKIWYIKAALARAN